MPYRDFLAYGASQLQSMASAISIPGKLTTARRPLIGHFMEEAQRDITLSLTLNAYKLSPGSEALEIIL
jgi:hypothetical protein